MIKRRKANDKNIIPPATSIFYTPPKTTPFNRWSEWKKEEHFCRSENVGTL